MGSVVTDLTRQHQDAKRFAVSLTPGTAEPTSVARTGVCVRKRLAMCPGGWSNPGHVYSAAVSQSSMVVRSVQGD